MAVLAATGGTGASEDNTTRWFYEDGRHPSLYHVPTDAPAGTPKLLLVGDSGGIYLGPKLVQAGQLSGVAAGFSALPQCSVVIASGDGVQAPDGRIVPRPFCPEDRLGLWGETVDQFRPDVVVYYLANAGGEGRMHVEDDWVRDCDAAYDDYLAEALRDDIAQLQRQGATVVLATSPYVGFDEEAPERVDCRNELYRRLADESDGSVQVVDFNAFVADQMAAGIAMFRDPLHLSDEGAHLVATWLLTELELPPAGS